VRDEEGRVVLAIVVSRDVTELRDLEESREEFVNLVSHDLRSPLATAQGYVQLIQGKPDRSELVRRSAESINLALHRMNRMIQDLVETARLETGQLRLERIPLDPGSFTVDLKERLSVSLDTGRVQVDVVGVPSTVLADPARLERVMTNLLSNALKYSDGEVVVRVEGSEGEVKVSVVDQGPGIAPEERGHIFERYYRSKRHRKAEGLGLGLYITRLLVEAHGGKLWLESEVGRGSTFCFTLPAA
jgi:two-component system phosphate regulon sensor histidine kinase PhoR